MPRALMRSISTSTSRERIKLPTGWFSTVPPFRSRSLRCTTRSEGRLLSVTKQPFGTVAHLESSAVNTPRIETEVILFNGQKKIEFINRVHKTEVFTKEGVYFAFPLAMDHPRFRYEIQNGIVDPATINCPEPARNGFPCSTGWRRSRAA